MTHENGKRLLFTALTSDELGLSARSLPIANEPAGQEPEGGLRKSVRGSLLTGEWFGPSNQ